MSLRTGLLALPALLAASCLSGRPPWMGHDYALVTGGTIYPDAHAAPVEALLVEDGRVLAVGTRAELEERAAAIEEKAKDWWVELEVRRIDLGGGTAVPGLVDAHGHVENLGAKLDGVDLVGVTSFEEVVERVAARAAELPSGSWIVGRGWDQTLWPGREFPVHDALSARVPEHPVYLSRVDGHAALVNANALALAGLDRALPDVPGGRIVVDEAGRPTGVLVDEAMGLVSRNIPEPDRATRRRRLLAAQDALLACGLTAVHDMGTDPEALAVLRALEEEGVLHLRVLAYVWGNDGVSRTEQAFRTPEFVLCGSCYPHGRDACKAPLVGAKLMVDGALGSRGAALLEPYADAPGETGLSRLTIEELEARVREVVALGLQPATHAIGDRGNRMVLDVYERALDESSRQELRPRLEHAQVVAEADWSRFRELGVVPSMQPTHATSDMRWAEARVGPERVRGAYAWKRLPGEGAPLALGSDFPVEDPSPLLGLHAARTRQDAAGNPPGGWLPDQRLSAADALAGFTSGAAWAAREETRRGRLHPGFAADLTVLDVDPLTCAPEELLGARVLATIIDGEVAFSTLHAD